MYLTAVSMYPCMCLCFTCYYYCVVCGVSDEFVCDWIEIDSDQSTQKGYSSLLSFTVTDINSTVTKLMALGAELDGPIKYEVHGKVLSSNHAMQCYSFWKLFTALIISSTLKKIKFDVIYLVNRLQLWGALMDIS